MLNVDIRLIRGVWHAQALINGWWKVVTFDHHPTAAEALRCLVS